MKWRRTAVRVLLSAGLVACAPALDWREFVAEGSGVVATFPCRPDRHARSVVVADVPVRMEMLVCTAGGSTFALSFFDVSDPARVSGALGELRTALLANVHGLRPRSVPARVSGMTPNPQAIRLAAEGRLPDGTVVQAHAEFFVKGLRVFQAALIGAAPASQDIEAFFSGLRFPS